MNKRNFIYAIISGFLFILVNTLIPKRVISKINNTNILFHKNSLKYKISKDHPEKPERILYLLDKIKNFKLRDSLININLSKIEHNPYSWIRKIHTTDHISSLKLKNPNGEIASKTATLVCLHGIDSIMNKKSKNVFCLVRPPGHHALNTGNIEGFCFYNHIAITAKYLQSSYDVEKILIVDWDYHHGNSTEYFFYEDPSILFFSTHDQFAYPGTGAPNKKGRGKGLGFNYNIHLPCGTNDEDFLRVYKEQLVPIANKFEPEFILISAGFDSRKDDPLGCFNLTDKAFEEVTKLIMNLANKNCEGRILSILEGGYNIEGNSKATIKHVKTLKNLI